MKAEEINVYPGRDAVYNRELARLKQEDTTQRNKDLITGFQNYTFAQQSKSIRVAKLSCQMRNICRWLNKGLNIKKNLDQLDKNDIIGLVGFINRLEEKAEATRSDYKRCLKQFYKWFKKNDPRLESENKMILRDANKFYDFIEHDVTRKYTQKVIRFDEIVTDEDLKMVLMMGFEGIDYPQRDKAILSLLHETGCRAGELLTMRIRSISREDKHCRITLEGKTGVRNIVIVSSVPYLNAWLDCHPFKNNQQAPLWHGFSRFHKGRPLTQSGLYAVLNKAFMRAGVNKQCNPHWFRHSRATILSQHLTEVQLCKYMGWAIGSRQVRTYCHASDKQTDESILKLHGQLRVEKKAPVTTPKDCPTCKKINPGINEYCSQCGTPLTLTTAIKHEDQVKDATSSIMNKFLQMIADNPEVIQEFQKFKESWKG